ncbi:uncharacterized protein N7473_001838 [Penicillium subrubescens]|uniref:uncharacterized protein n=1 Tax=Penicillium subrubescens TaxID=1316194 RepID=UPI002544D9C5|nr:uncharacterized protein N7473_001838 [Penicillium subrubescens]KAJ5904922.1 hypothetical protein N7473_001838 [Penicillium subrubescens]
METWVLHPQLRGQLYHNRITLTNFSVGGAFLVAYNFAYLATCRDRLRPKSWRDAARQVQHIWEAALGKQKDTVLPLLVDLERSNDQTTNTIRDSLGKRPARLPDTLWQMLRAHGPIGTVEEEQQKRFKDAKPCILPDTTFARAVDRALRACFALLKFTDHIQVVYIRGSTGKVDVYFDKGQELLVRSLASMFKAHPTSRPAELRFMRQIGRRLRYLPHSIQLKPYSGGILVSWEDNEAESVRRLGPSGPDYHIVLHDDKCANAEMALLLHHAALPNDVVPCGCRRQFARQAHRMCLFTGLSHTSTCYAMISLNEDRAFYGVPSDRVSPESYEKVGSLSL